MFATFGSLGACVGEDFSFAVLLFPHIYIYIYIFLVSLVLRLVVAVAFQGLSFFPLRFCISGFVFFSLFIVGTLLVAQYLRFSLLPACGSIWLSSAWLGEPCLVFVRVSSRLTCAPVGESLSC